MKCKIRLDSTGPKKPDFNIRAERTINLPFVPAIGMSLAWYGDNIVAVVKEVTWSVADECFLLYCIDDDSDFVQDRTVEGALSEARYYRDHGWSVDTGSCDGRLYEALCRMGFTPWRRANG